MNRSESIAELVSALAKAQGEYTAALKESQNPAFRSKYADLGSIVSAIRPALSKHGIAIVQDTTSDLERTVASVTTSLHCGEQWISTTAEAPAVGRQGNFDAQTLGTAWTYLRRYTLQSLAGIAAEDDDDANAVSGATAMKTAEDWQRDQNKKMWQQAFNECPSIDEWNEHVVPLMKEKAMDPDFGKPFIIAAAEEAKKRGYLGDRTSGLYKEASRITKQLQESLVK